MFFLGYPLWDGFEGRPKGKKRILGGAPRHKPMPCPSRLLPAGSSHECSIRREIRTPEIGGNSRGTKDLYKGCGTPNKGKHSQLREAFRALGVANLVFCGSANQQNQARRKKQDLAQECQAKRHEPEMLCAPHLKYSHIVGFSSHLTRIGQFQGRSSSWTAGPEENETVPIDGANANHVLAKGMVEKGVYSNSHSPDLVPFESGRRLARHGHAAAAPASASSASSTTAWGCGGGAGRQRLASESGGAKVSVELGGNVDLRFFLNPSIYTGGNVPLTRRAYSLFINGGGLC